MGELKERVWQDIINKTEEDKIETAKRKQSVKCTCGCRIFFDSFNDRGWTVCHNCKKRITKPRDEFKNKLKEMLKEK